MYAILKQTTLLIVILTFICSAAVFAQSGCCLSVTYGPAHPPDHSWQPDPAAPIQPNLMMHARLCLPTSCPQAVSISGFTLKALGSGNDATDIAGIRILVDENCDGTPDRVFASHMGGYQEDDGVIHFCNPNDPMRILPGQCVCIMVEYIVKDSAKCDTDFQFLIAEVLAGPNCNPIPLCNPNQPLASAVKTITCTDCCLDVSYGAGHPDDHDFQCIPGTAPQPNLMQSVQICNPCPDEVMYVAGLRLRAGGTGNDATGIQKVVVSLDFDCDGKPDKIAVITGKYDVDNGILELCRDDGQPLFRIPPGGCVCVQIHYIMECPAPPGTYAFDLEAILGSPDCQPLCADPLPIRSAIKTVREEPCCLEVSLGPEHPEDHIFTCPPTGAPGLNFMQQLQICNPCHTDQPIHGVRIKAWGSGNDATGISQVELWIDSNCDGVPDQGPVAVAVFHQDNGEALLCSTGPPIAVLKPGECICLNIYYRMKCPDTVPGTYAFEVVEVLGPFCEDICAGPLPLRSAVKTIEPKPCCLKVSTGPANPPNHSWSPGMPRLNKMFQIQVCNLCDTPARIECITLQAAGTGDDAKDIRAVRVFWDVNCDGIRQPGEPVFGTGVYPVDNGVVTICAEVPISMQAGQCLCLMVEYIMAPGSKPGATYGMRLIGLDAVNLTTGAQLCVEGLPLASNIKRRSFLIGEVKLAPLGSRVEVMPKVVTAVFPDRFYIQEPFQTTPPPDENKPGDLAHGPGIAVLRNPGPPDMQGPPAVGDLVRVEGIVDVMGCEVVIRPDDHTTTALLLPAVQKARMRNNSSGGGQFGNQSGVVDSFFDVFHRIELSQSTNNIGQLVQLAGRVTGAYGDTFWIDDGSKLADGSVAPNGERLTGVKVDARFAGFVPPEGSFVLVTGIMRAQEKQGLCIRCLVPRGRADIEVVEGPR